MLTWLQNFMESNRETRLFFITAFIYVAAVILPVLYCYLRLDYVRSYETTAEVIETQGIRK